MAKLFDRTIDGIISCDNLHQNQGLNIRFLLDTGALQANYISLDLANKLRERGCFYQDVKHTVCSPIMKCKCIESRGLISFRLKYLCFAVGRYETIYIEARVLDIGCELILGLPTIKTNDLVTNFAHLFSSADISHAINLANKHNTQDTTQSISPRSVSLMLVREMRHNDRIPMEEILTIEQEFVDEFDDDLPNCSME